jgi:hypothetical protein
MNRYYKAVISKVALGAAVEYREPAIQGRVLRTVSDSTTGGDFKLYIVATDDAQHQRNLALIGVESLTEAEAAALGAAYQPARTVMQFNPQTRQLEQIAAPAFDLMNFLNH